MENKEREFTYTHPKTYKVSGYDYKENTEIWQNRLRYCVEHYCLQCSNFCGKDHDFADCKFFNKKGGINECPRVITEKTVYPVYPIDDETLKNGITFNVEE